MNPSNNFLMMIDLAPELKKKLLEQVRLAGEIQEVRSRLDALNIRYIGETRELYWFKEPVSGGALTIKKNEFTPAKLEAEVKSFRRRFGIK